MTASVVGVVREGVLLVLWLAAPFLVAALLAGIVSGLIGAFTQIQDPSLGLLPRVVAVGAALVMFAPSIGHQLDVFTSRLWPMIAAVGTSSG
ncbi:MAG TPA: flagellar biosynthetic protein FliQ [Kofleriaceae bacterium]|nr:flagellar biosynthetic protein FliQ [Kofleriaceae bacterium]